MNLTDEEKLMYRVMKTVYESGIPISFKGSMVLKACLAEAGLNEDIRHTVDIDANWTEESISSPEKIIDSLQHALTQNGINLQVSLYRMFGEKRSAGIQLSDCESGENLFTMDIDVNRPVPQTRIYEIDDIRFCGATPAQMIADKIETLSSDTIYIEESKTWSICSIFQRSSVFAVKRF